jgi:hypothetical protein
MVVSTHITFAATTTVVALTISGLVVRRLPINRSPCVLELKVAMRFSAQQADSLSSAALLSR